MKKLLVPIDFSEQSINAFRFSLDVASKTRGTICLLHVLSLPALRDSAIMPVREFKTELVRELTAIAEKRFSAIIKEYNIGRIGIKTRVVQGRVHPAILECIEKENIDLVIMGTKGVAGIRERIIGSTIEKIVRTSPVPLFAVKDYVSGMSIKNIVFPYTLNADNQRELVMKIKAVQSLFNATLHLTWVNTPTHASPEVEIRQRLHAFAKWFMLTDYTVNIFNYSDEESGITEFTKSMKADLIAMGTRGLTGLLHFLTGSLAEDLVNHVTCPVWTYRTKSTSRVAIHK